MKIVKQFKLKIVIFTAVKNRCILHGRVFVMSYLNCPMRRLSMHTLWEHTTYFTRNVLNA